MALNLKNEKISSIKNNRKLFERKTDSELWTKVKNLSKGTITNKISAADIIFKNYYRLPEESIEIPKQLADKKQPLKIRLHIAENLIEYPNIPSGMHETLLQILSVNNNDQITKIISKSSLVELSRQFQNDLLPFVKQIRDIVKNIDWVKFQKMYHVSMIQNLNAVKDDRTTAILSQVLAEYWLNMFMKSFFQNSQELLKLSFDNKRKILFGLKILKPTTNNDLKKLDDIRSEYAHNFKVDDKKILKILEKMDCYKNIKFRKNSKNNNRIKRCAIKLILDLMDTEKEFIIKVLKKKK